jgi:hypothetical protein
LSVSRLEKGTQLVPPSVIENFVVGIVTSFVTALAVWIWRNVRESQILNRKAEFFNISRGESCLAVMNHNPRGRDMMSHSDIETLVEVVRIVDEIGGTVTIAPFDKVLEPAGGITEFCIGSPASNDRTKVHAENFLKGVKFLPYSPESPDSLAIITSEGKFRHEAYEEEYAVLTRFYPHPASQPIFLISGQTARSNHGATHYLLENYNNSLRKKFGSNRPFCLLLKLQSPRTYGHKSVRLVADITNTAFSPLPTTT